MDVIFICRDALANSLLGNLLLAMEAHKAGTKVAVLFTEDALAALSTGAFLWPQALQGQPTRLAMANNASALDVPVMLRGEGRQVNALGMVEKAHQAGVPMYACPAWSQLLDVKGKLPEGIAEIDLPTALKTLGEAKQVIGSF
jgi:peroxiredoxin family protein